MLSRVTKLTFLEQVKGFRVIRVTFDKEKPNGQNAIRRTYHAKLLSGNLALTWKRHSAMSKSGFQDYMLLITLKCAQP